jgi:hypothetical protein
MLGLPWPILIAALQFTSFATVAKEASFQQVDLRIQLDRRQVEKIAFLKKFRYIHVQCLPHFLTISTFFQVVNVPFACHF